MVVELGYLWRWWRSGGYGGDGSYRVLRRSGCGGHDCFKGGNYDCCMIAIIKCIPGGGWGGASDGVVVVVVVVGVDY